MVNVIDLSDSEQVGAEAVQHPVVELAGTPGENNGTTIFLRLDTVMCTEFWLIEYECGCSASPSGLPDGPPHPPLSPNEMLALFSHLLA